MDKYDDKYDSKYTSKVLQELDETFQSMRTPKQLLSKTKRAREKSSSRDQQKMNFVQSNNLKRKKKVKKVVKGKKKKNKDTTNIAVTKKDIDHTVEFFGKQFNHTDLNTNMGGGAITSNKLEEEEKEPSKVKIFYLDEAKNLQVDLPVSAAMIDDPKSNDIVFESAEETNSRKHKNNT